MSIYKYVSTDVCVCVCVREREREWERGERQRQKYSVCVYVFVHVCICVREGVYFVCEKDGERWRKMETVVSVCVFGCMLYVYG